MADEDFQIEWDTALEGFGDYVPAPADTYVMEITEAHATKASTGSPMIVTTMKIIGGPHDGKVVMNNLVAQPGNEKNQKMFLRNLVNFGIPKEWLDTRPGGMVIAQQLVGKRANVEVVIKELDNGPSNNVTKIKRLASAVPGTPPVSTGPVPTPPTPTGEVYSPPQAPPVPPAPTVPAPPTMPAPPPIAPPPSTPPVAPAAPAAPPAPPPAPAPAEAAAPATPEAPQEPF